MPSQGSVVSSTILPWAVQSRIGTNSGRYALNGMIMPVPNLSYIDYRSGVFASGDTAGVGGSGHMAMKVKPGNGMNVTVEMGNCVINTPGQGAYMAAVDSQKTLSLAASQTNSSRIDLIIARIYDDQNSAINSAVNTRKFTVEVYQGDTTAGTPARPVPNFQGYIPLAAVSIAQKATGITTANITDLRGPGLVARGGMRALYGTDAQQGSTALNEPGAYPGDQRWVHTSGFQHQVYYGAGTDPKNSGWRGVHNAMVYNANPAGDTGWIKGTGATRDVCSITIPYPGTPFMIYPSARAMVYQSKQTAVDFWIVQNDGADHIVNWDRVDTGALIGDPGGPTDTRQGFNIAPIMWGPFTAGITVRLTGFVYIAALAGGGFALDDFTKTLLSVVVYPSTVQPPAA